MTARLVDTLCHQGNGIFQGVGSVGRVIATFQSSLLGSDSRSYMGGGGGGGGGG